MLVYKFLGEQWALDDIRKRRVKISEIHDLNDPFELIPFNLSDPVFRRDLLRARDEMNKTGVLSFSLSWSSPLLWAHYAEKHKGICLGFDWSGKEETFIPVNYEPQRLQPPSKPADLDENLARRWLSTKSVDWKYEEEVRVFATRDEEEDGNYFANFDHNNLTLRKVIVGYRCCVERGSILALLTDPSYSKPVTVIKARPAYASFLVVEDEDGFSS